MNTEETIVSAVEKALTNTFAAASEDLESHLFEEGFTLQPYDLDFILRRHPALFRTDHRGRWMLA